MWYGLQHLNLSYEDQVILDDMSLEVKEDEFIGVLGDSGSGKTQLSLAIGGLNRFYGAKISSQSNTFSYEGKESNLTDTIAAVEFRRLSIGYILQEAFSYFNPVLKIKQQLADKNFNSDDIKTLLPAIGLPDIDRILNSYPHQLSGGQLQRLAIVTCMAGSPQIIVADEIESALDAENASLVFDLLLKLKKEKKFSLIWVTHDQHKAKKLCDRIWYVRAGKLEYDGPAASFIPFRVEYPTAPTDHVGGEVIRLAHINKSYVTTLGSFGNKKPVENIILNDVSWSVKKGEVIGLIGSSGSGKSTLARIVAGIEPADQGQIYIEGNLVAVHKLNKNIIYLFQDAYSSLNPSLSCRTILGEAIAAGAGRLSISKLLSMGNLPVDILDKRPSALSGGMRQRLALLRAIACGPELLILDESLNALNTGLQVSILEMLFRFQKDTGLAILIISHQSILLTRVCHRVYKLMDGSLSQVG